MHRRALQARVAAERRHPPTFAPTSHAAGACPPSAARSWARLICSATCGGSRLLTAGGALPGAAELEDAPAPATHAQASEAKARVEALRCGGSCSFERMLGGRRTCRGGFAGLGCCCCRRGGWPARRRFRLDGLFEQVLRQLDHLRTRVCVRWRQGVHGVGGAGAACVASPAPTASARTSVRFWYTACISSSTCSPMSSSSSTCARKGATDRVQAGACGSAAHAAVAWPSTHTTHVCVCS